MGARGKGYEKLSKIIDVTGLEEDISDLLNISTTELMSKIKKENGADFDHFEALKLCRFFGFTFEELFFT